MNWGGAIGNNSGMTESQRYHMKISCSKKYHQETISQKITPPLQWLYTAPQGPGSRSTPGASDDVHYPFDDSWSRMKFVPTWSFAPAKGHPSFETLTQVLWRAGPGNQVEQDSPGNEAVTWHRLYQLYTEYQSVRYGLCTLERSFVPRSVGRHQW